jgi:hypothetical protein
MTGRYTVVVNGNAEERLACNSRAIAHRVFVAQCGRRDAFSVRLIDSG